MTKKLNQVLAAVLTIVALATGQTAMADNGWDIQASTSGSVTTFTITRTNTAVAETVKYRFVNLSAYAGQHYNVSKVNGQNSSALSGEFTFAAGDTDSRTITVTESAGSGAYAYYKDTTKRSYKLEITDAGGFELTSKTRSFTIGTSINSSNVYAEKSVTVSSDPITVTDGGFTQAYNAVTIADYYTAAAPKAYLVAAGAELRMKVELEEAEKEDGYQHIQLLVNQTSNCDNSANKGNPGTPSYSRYLASFAHKPGSTLTSYGKVCFPLTSASDNCAEIDPAWNFSPYKNSDGKLYTQKFKSGYRADDGKLLVAKKSELSSLSTVGIRFDASGDNSDTWYARNVTALFTAVDVTAPTKQAVSVAPGYHAKGNILYVSVAFSEIVTISGSVKQLSTSWGNLTYIEGSGTNVLTFSGKISASASGSLSITGLTGTVQDLASKGFTWSGTETPGTSLDASYEYTITYNLDGGSVATDNPTTYTYETAAITLNNPTLMGCTFAGWTGSNGNTSQTAATIAQYSHGNKSYTANWTDLWGVKSGADGSTAAKAYTITTTDGLDQLAQYVNAGNTFSGKFFKLGGSINYSHNTDWDNANSTENNYTAIGNNEHHFSGTFDGQGFTVSGIRIYKSGTDNSDRYQGLFGAIAQGKIMNVKLADGRITGHDYVGGLMGVSYGSTVDDCTVASDVCIHALGNTSSYHGGIVGNFTGGTMQRSISSATLTIVSNSSQENYGGIVGYSENGTIKDCLAVGVVMPEVARYNGYIVGKKDNSNATTLARNYYRDCTGLNKYSGTGDGVYEINNGAMPVYSITLGDNVTIAERTPSATLPGTNNKTYANGAAINGVEYYAGEYTTVTLGYSGTANSGYHVEYTATDGTIKGNKLTMPYADVTVTATVPANSYTVHFDANATNGIPVTTGTMDDLAFTYDAAQALTANGFTRTGYTFAGWNTAADGTGTTYTDQQATPNVTGENGATVTLYAQWNAIPWEGSGTEESPYLIIYPSQLVKLADDVNGGNKYSGKYIKLGKDIDMDGVAFDGIGNIENGFEGYLDGDHKAISNITISYDGSTKNLGFISYMNYTWVKNLTLINANVYAPNNNYPTGILVGNAFGTINIENCLVINSSVVGNQKNRIGIIMGNYSDNKTLINNYYLNCTRTVGSTTITTNIGTNSGDIAGARSVHTLTLPEHVTVTSAETVTYNNVTYYAAGVDVTLAPEAGFRLAGITVDGNAATDNGDGTWTFTMPAADATVTATISVPYIDENGDEQECTDYTFIESSNSDVKLGTSGEEHWYVVSGNVSITKTDDDALNFNGAARLILCDDATLTLSGKIPLWTSGSLAIYGQSQGTGSLTAEGSSTAIMVSEYGTLANNGTLTINGGSITAHSTGSNGINVSNSITINGGTVSATSDNQFSNGISSSSGDITINGGTVSATGGNRGYGINANSTITLGWTNLTDRITVSRYDENNIVSIKDGLAFSNGSESLIGTITDMSKLNGKTLKPAIPYIAADGSTQYCGEYTMLNSSNEQFNHYGTDGQTNWYVVSGDVTIGGQLKFLNSHSHLIVCDGAKLAASSLHDAIYGSNGGITIYGQTQGSGTVSAISSSSTGIRAFGQVTINGGNVTATGRKGISANGEIIINRGTFTANGTTSGISGYDVTINGGNVSATGSTYGIYSTSGTITLGYTNATDRICASSCYINSQYGVAIKVKDGQTLTDGTALYTGTLTDEQIDAIGGKTLQSVESTVAYIDADGKTKYCTDYTVLSDQDISFTDGEGTIGIENQDTWYVLKDDVSFRMEQKQNYSIRALGHVHLILCDGATFTMVNNRDYCINADGLTIYGQSEGTGRLVAYCLGGYNSDYGAISYSNALTINGGDIDAHGAGYNGISGVSGSLTINGGIVNIIGLLYGIYVHDGNISINGGIVNVTGNLDYGITANGNISILGGTVTVISNSDSDYREGIYVSGTITLGWSNLTDRIYASSYKFAPDFITVKDGQTLTDGSGRAYSSTLTGEQIGDIAGQTLRPATSVVFAEEGYGTAYYGDYDLVLPAGMKARIVTDNNGGTLTYETIADGDDTNKTVPAGTPVMLQVEATGESQTLGIAIAAPEASAITATNYLQGSDTQCTTTGDGKHYKLSYNQSGEDIGWYWGADGGAAFTSAAHKAWLALPATVNARFFALPDFEEDGMATGIRSMQNAQRTMHNDVYDLQGRKLNGQLKKGVYIVNGKKTVIK